jgi:hypothetical protein
MNKSFTMNGQTMVYDRGRYKTAENVGSVNDAKRYDDYLKNAAEKAKREMVARYRATGNWQPIATKPYRGAPWGSKKRVPRPGTTRIWASKRAA